MKQQRAKVSKLEDEVMVKIKRATMNLKSIEANV